MEPLLQQLQHLNPFLLLTRDTLEGIYKAYFCFTRWSTQYLRNFHIKCFPRGIIITSQENWKKPRVSFNWKNSRAVFYLKHPLGKSYPPLLVLVSHLHKFEKKMQFSIYLAEANVLFFRQISIIGLPWTKLPFVSSNNVISICQFMFIQQTFPVYYSIKTFPVTQFWTSYLQTLVRMLSLTHRLKIACKSNEATVMQFLRYGWKLVA